MPGLVDVARPCELGAPHQGLQLCAYVRRLQIGPAHHARDERMAVGQLEQPPRLLESLSRLDGDTGVEAGTAQLRLEVGGQEVAPEGGQGSVDPLVLDGVVMPEVLMRVDAARGNGEVTAVVLPRPDRA